MSEVIFDTCDAYGNPIGHPKEPLVNVLYNRLEVLKDGHNNLVQDVITKNSDMDANKLIVDNNLDILSMHSNTHTHEIDKLKETDKLVLDMLEIFELRAIDAISAEETLRILRMRQSPDEENHVMAANIIRNKRIEFGLSVADEPENEQKPE